MQPATYPLKPVIPMNPQETLSTLPDPTFRQLCERVVADMDRLSVPGVAVGVLAGDQESAVGFGVTSVENPLPVTADTLFQIGSITKTFVGGTLIYPLLDRALSLYLDLDNPKATPIDVPLDRLQAFAGRYDSALTGAEITLGEGLLVLQAFDKGGFPTPDMPPGPPLPPGQLVFYAEDRVVGLDEPYKDARGEFLRGPDGRVAWLRVGGRLHRRVDAP